MLARALLFSSDEHTSDLLTQALAELPIQVEHCPEIFDAIEKLTTRRYQIVIADWAQEVEASFFLKAARDLEFSQSIFSLAVVLEKDTAAALQTGVNGILAKPVTAEQVKNVLTAALNAACPDATRAGTQVGTQEENVPSSRPEKPVSELLAADLPSLARTAGDPFHIENLSYPRESFSFGGYARTQLAPAGSKHLGRRLGWLGALAVLTAIAWGGWKLGYGDVALKYRQGSSADKTSEAKPAVEERQTTSSASKNEEAGWVTGLKNVDGGSEDSFPPVSRAHIRVRPVLPPSQNTKGRPAAPPPSTVAVKVSATPEIPDSLLVPAPTKASKTVASTPHAPGSPWTADPLMLPEEVSRPMLVHCVLPTYPEKAVGTGLQGPVVLQAWVGRDGSVREVKLIRGYLVFGEAAFQAVRQWRYQPYRLNGEIVEMQTFVTVDFRRP